MSFPPFHIPQSAHKKGAQKLHILINGSLVQVGLAHPPKALRIIHIPVLKQLQFKYALIITQARAILLFALDCRN